MKAGEIADSAKEVAQGQIIIELSDGAQVDTSGFWVRENKKGEPILVIKAARKLTDSWIKVDEKPPSIDQPFIGWHESEGLVICGPYVGHWSPEEIQENLRLKRFTDWQSIERPAKALD